MKIGIVLTATNSFWILGARFIKQFYHHHTGDAQVTIFCFSDVDLREYVSEPIVYQSLSQKNWRESVNSKFELILGLESQLKEQDYVLYIDADTSAQEDFDLVAWCG
ncbi:MAG: hypothetical protein AAF197_13515, partial [Pseudomonadota bacterium]